MGRQAMPMLDRSKPHETAQPARAAVIRVLVVRAEGSTPRAAGAAMRVDAVTANGSIGGGALELDGIVRARALLEEGVPPWWRELRSLPLGPSLGQCCGGHVTLLLEAVPAGEPVAQRGTVLLRALGDGLPPLVQGGASQQPRATLEPSRALQREIPATVVRVADAMLSGRRPLEVVLIPPARGEPAWVIEPAPPAKHPLYLYGAGHVGRALVRALDGLPFAIRWIDTAADRFPAAVRADVACVVAAQPEVPAASAPADALHLVMTYSHPLDLAICHAVLAAGQFAQLSVIGSETKRARFLKRLAEAGIAPEQLTRLTCPIGLPGIRGKEPASIAISVAAALLQWAEAQAR
jgi:xanthine dehydrogenase accessory factor